MARLLLPLLLMATSLPTMAGDTGIWQRFIDRFITPEGRVVDTQSDNISHSEGQGYGLVLATHFDDRETFRAIHQWTRNHLAVRSDGLLAWAWDPAGGEIRDRNAAIDGDILVAWGLLRGARRWDEPALREAAGRRLRAVREQVVRWAEGPVLKPGPEGFVHGDTLTLNASYWVFPALRDFAAAEGAPWDRLFAHGVALTRELRQRYTLIPDWVGLTRAGSFTSPGTSEPLRASFDAVRVPLYLAWACERAGVVSAYAEHWERERSPEGEYRLAFNPASGETSMTGHHPAFAAIHELAADRSSAITADTLARDYYPAVIQLLARVARQEAAACD